MGVSSSILLSVNTKNFKESDRAPSFECLIGDRGNSEAGSSIFSDDALPSLTDVTRRDSSVSSFNQNLYEVKFEETSSSTLTFGEIYVDHEKRKKKIAMVNGIPVTAGTVGLAVLIGLRVLTMTRTSNFKPQGGRHDPSAKDKQESQIYGPQKQNPHDPSLLLDANNSFSNKKDEDEEGGSELVNKTRRVNRGMGTMTRTSNFKPQGGRHDPTAKDKQESKIYGPQKQNPHDPSLLDANNSFSNKKDEDEEGGSEPVNKTRRVNMGKGRDSSKASSKWLRKTLRFPIQRPKTPMDPPVSHNPNAVDMELKEETYLDLDPSTFPPDDPEQPRFATTGSPGASSSVTSYAAHDEMRPVNRGKGKGSSKNNSNIVERDDPRADETNYYENATFTNAQDHIQQEDGAVVGPFSRSESRTRCLNTLMNTPMRPSQRPETPMDPLVSHHPNAVDMDMTRVNRGKGRGSSKDNSNIVGRGDPRVDETDDYEDFTFTNELDRIQKEDDAVVGPFSGSESRTRYRNTLRKKPRHPSQRPETPMDPLVSHHPNAADMELKEETYVDLDLSTIPPDDPEQPRFATTGSPGASSSVTSYAAHDELTRVNRGKGRGSSKDNSNIVGHGDPRVDETGDYEDSTFTNELDRIQKEDDAVVVSFSGSESRTRYPNTLRKKPRHPSQRPKTPMDPLVSHHPNAADMEYSQLKEETYDNLNPSTIPPEDLELGERSDEEQPQFATTGPLGASFNASSYAAHDEMTRVNRGKGRGSSKDNSNIIGHGDPRVDETGNYEDSTFTKELDRIQKEDDAVLVPFSGSESRTRYRDTLRKKPRHPSQRPETPMDPLVSHHPNAADIELKEEIYGDFDPSTIPPDDPELGERSDEEQPQFATTGPPGANSSVTSYAAHDEMRPVNRGKGKGADETNYYEDATFTKAQEQIQQEDDAVVGPFSRSESRTRCRNTLMKTPRHPSQRPETPMDPLVSHHPNAVDMELKEETYGDLDPSTIPPDDPELWERSDEEQPRFATTGPPGANSSVTSYAARDEMRRINRGKGRGFSKDSKNIVRRGDPRADETNEYEAATFTNELDQIQQKNDAVLGPFSGLESRTRCRNTLRKTPKHPSQRPETPMDPTVYHYSKAADMPLIKETYVDVDPSTILTDDQELWERSDEGQPRFSTTDLLGANSNVTSYGAYDEKRRLNKGKGRGSSEASSNTIGHGDTRTDANNDYDVAIFTNESDLIQLEDDAVVVLSSGSESRTRCRNTLRKTPRHLSQRLETPTYPPIYHYPKATDMMLKEETYVYLDPSTIPPDDPESLKRSDEG